MEEQLAADQGVNSRAKTLPTAADLIALSQELLDAVRNAESNPAAIAALERLDFGVIVQALSSDGARKTFWINIYNAFNLILMQQLPPGNKQARIRVFFVKRMKVAGISMSLNQIEHGILRRSRIWWAKGWLSNPIPSRWIAKAQVQQLDPRIHFALNCGANGCPAIRHYTLEGIDKELELATKVFLEFETKVTAETVELSEILRMYLGDFGGKKALLRWLGNYLPGIQRGMKIRFRPYDWTLNLQKWGD